MQEAKVTYRQVEAPKPKPRPEPEKKAEPKPVETKSGPREYSDAELLKAGLSQDMIDDIKRDRARSQRGKGASPREELRPTEPEAKSPAPQPVQRGAGRRCGCGKRGKKPCRCEERRCKDECCN